jgi:hypothetical protein
MKSPKSRGSRSRRRGKPLAPHTSKPAKKFPFPVPIPPGSIVAVKDIPRSPWAKKIGRVFRIGYYSRMDGLDCIWLIDETGQYRETLDHDYLEKFFEIRSISKERGLYGRGRPPFPRLKPAPVR